MIHVCFGAFAELFHLLTRETEIDNLPDHFGMAVFRYGQDVT